MPKDPSKQGHRGIGFVTYSSPESGVLPAFPLPAFVFLSTNQQLMSFRQPSRRRLSCAAAAAVQHSAGGTAAARLACWLADSRSCA